MLETVFLCPQCASTEYTESNGIYTCRYCGMSLRQAAKTYDDKDQLIYQDAIKLRSNYKFEEATDPLDDLISRHGEDGKLYYQRLLATLGVRFIDIEDGEKVRKTTISRLSPRRVYEFEDAKKALRFAESPEEEKEFRKAFDDIEAIRERAYEVSKNARKYQVFLSFKHHSDTDASANTADYEVAKEIYTYLKKNNVDVFFSPVSLQDYAGKDYEPIIYNALQTANVMILVEASPDKEYINFPWIRNEWGRFLTLMEEEQSKSGSYKKKLISVLAKGYPIEKLPARIKKLQCLEFDANFYANLEKAIRDSVTFNIEEHIKKIGDAKIAVKPIELTVRDIKSRTFGGQSKDDDATVSADLQKILNIAMNKVNQKDYAAADSDLEYAAERFPEKTRESADFCNLALKVKIMGSGLAPAKWSAKEVQDSNTRESMLKLIYFAIHGKGAKKENVAKGIPLGYSVITNALEANYLQAFSELKKIVDEAAKECNSSATPAMVNRWLEIVRTRIKERKIGPDEVLLVMDAIFNDMFTHFGNDSIYQNYARMGDCFFMERRFSEAKIFYEKSLEYFAAYDKAVRAFYLATHGVTDERELVSRCAAEIDFAADVRQILAKIHQGGFNYTERDYLYDNNTIFHRMMDVVYALFEQCDFERAMAVFKVIYEYVPESPSSTAFAVDTLRRLTLNFLAEKQFSFAKECLNEYGKLDASETGKQWTLILNLCIAFECQNLLDFYLDENIDFDSKQLKDFYFQLLSENPNAIINWFIESHQRVIHVRDDNKVNILRIMRKHAADSSTVFSDLQQIKKIVENPKLLFDYSYQDASGRAVYFYTYKKLSGEDIYGFTGSVKSRDNIIEKAKQEIDEYARSQKRIEERKLLEKKKIEEAQICRGKARRYNISAWLVFSMFAVTIYVIAFFLFYWVFRHLWGFDGTFAPWIGVLLAFLIIDGALAFGLGGIIYKTRITDLGEGDAWIALYFGQLIFSFEFLHYVHGPDMSIFHMVSSPIACFIFFITLWGAKKKNERPSFIHPLLGTLLSSGICILIQYIISICGPLL